MEYIVLASSPGIATQGLLDLFNNPGGETVFVKFAMLRDTGLIHTSSHPSATRIVFHGEYAEELITHIHTTHPTSKNILVFDTAEAAILQELPRNDGSFSIDSCIDNWTNCISQMSLLAEQNHTTSVLIDYASFTNTAAHIIAQVNKRLGVQLSNCPVNATGHSSIARLIAAAALIDRDQAMVFYDDAKTLALTSQYNSSYTDAASLIARQQSAALNEFKALLKCLQGKSPTGNIASAIETQQSELEITLLQIQHLHEELEVAQINIKHMQQDIHNLLNSKESELEIALLQVNQLQEELEDTLDKYGFFERPLANTTILEKLLGEVPLLSLLRSQANTSI